jgi:hypothetical protein
MRWIYGGSGQSDGMANETESMSAIDRENLASKLRAVADEIESMSDDTRITAKAAVQSMCEDHPSLSYHDTSMGVENGFYVGYTTGEGSPGRTNLGSNRTTAEKELRSNGYELSITMIEDLAQSERRDYDLLLEVVVTDAT